MGSGKAYRKFWELNFQVTSEKTLAQECYENFEDKF